MADLTVKDAFYDLWILTSSNITEQKWQTGLLNKLWGDSTEEIKNIVWTQMSRFYHVFYIILFYTWLAKWPASWNPLYCAMMLPTLQERTTWFLLAQRPTETNGLWVLWHVGSSIDVQPKLDLFKRDTMNELRCTFKMISLGLNEASFYPVYFVVVL